MARGEDMREEISAADRVTMQLGIHPEAVECCCVDRGEDWWDACSLCEEAGCGDDLYASPCRVTGETVWRSDG